MRLIHRVPRTLADQPFQPNFSTRVYNRLSKVAQASGVIPSSRRYNITVCHKQRFIWFRVAKTGTRSLFRALDDANVVLDAEHPMDLHYPAHAYRDYFSFTIVRNPWDRIVSCWNNKIVDQNWWSLPDEELQHMRHFPNFVEYVCSLDPEKCDVHLRSQTSVIDLNHIDFVGRFERFAIDTQLILSRIGVNDRQLPSENNSLSREKDFRQYFDKTSADRIRKHYELDVQLFGYAFE